MGVFDWWKRRPTEPPGLQAWRTAWEAGAAGEPDRETVERLRAALDALAAPEEEIEIEREMLDGLLALCNLVQGVHAAGLPALETGHRVVGTDACHFSAPASMPDEPAEPAGRLLLTSRRAVFAGGAGIAIPWHALTDTLHASRDVILVSRGRERVHRFRCNSFTDALTASYIARRLVARKS